MGLARTGQTWLIFLPSTLPLLSLIEFSFSICRSTIETIHENPQPSQGRDQVAAFSSVQLLAVPQKYSFHRFKGWWWRKGGPTRWRKLLREIRGLH